MDDWQVLLGHPIIASFGDGEVVEAALGEAVVGLVPRQMSTGGRTILGRISKRGNTYSRPHQLEMYPDEGYPSLSMPSFDLLGCFDGINSEGVTVVVLGDEELVLEGVARDGKPKFNSSPPVWSRAWRQRSRGYPVPRP